MNDTFELDPRIAADTVAVTDLDLSAVRLMNDPAYPWLLLVPRRPGLRNFHDLTAADQAQATAEIVRASRVLEDIFAPDKINVAALGIIVAQLHIHVVARFTGDATWPAPVTRLGDPPPYDEAALAERIAALRAAFDA